MTDAPNSAPPPDPGSEKKQIPEVDPTTRTVHVGYQSQVPQGANAILGIAFWKIKHLAALVLEAEAQHEVQEQQNAAARIVPAHKIPKGLSRYLPGKH
jgi:multidrug efflux pump subunit AcrA (membrane-fusion protein)